MKKQLNESINVLVDKASSDKSSPIESQQYAQAALNLAHTKATLMAAKVHSKASK